MTSSNHPAPGFLLSREQQSLLFAALNSNRAQSTMSPTTFTQSPALQSDPASLNDSPFLDYDFSFDAADTSFDSLFDNVHTGQMIGDLPGTAAAQKAESIGSNSDSADGPEKRSHPDDDEDSGKGAKRRESTDKVPKKPGRKPLTSEPTSKRKAQNRAAQRAFRERKEKHVKDLEQKVEELEEASKAANHENTTLRAEVERLSTELKEYKKRIAVAANPRPQPAPTRPNFGTSMVSNIGDVNFQFEFPKFGALPGPPLNDARNHSSSTPSLTMSQSPSTFNSPSCHNSPTEGSRDKDKATPSSAYSIGLDAQTKEDLARFSGMFNPPLTNTNVANASRGSLDSHNGVGAGSTSSPSASSGSHPGPSSSCGTSPEPFTQSPMGFKPVDTLTTIGEESGSSQLGAHNLGFPTNTMNDVDWLSQANTFQFDPQLFGEYREPQDNILANGAGFGGDFFNDAWDIDFTTPFNMAPSPVAPKKDLLAEIDAAKEADDVDKEKEYKEKLLTCNKIWETLQTCPKVQSGDFDLDGLCSELQKKAKCSGYGAVVDQKDFQHAMKKYLGKTEKELEACGMSLQSAPEDG